MYRIRPLMQSCKDSLAFKVPHAGDRHFDSLLRAATSCQAKPQSRGRTEELESGTWFPMLRQSRIRSQSSAIVNAIALLTYMSCGFRRGDPNPTTVPWTMGSGNCLLGRAMWNPDDYGYYHECKHHSCLRTTRCLKLHLALLSWPWHLIGSS